MGTDDPSRREETARRGFLAPPDPCIPPPRIAKEPFDGPSLTIAEVCSRAGVPYRYSGGRPPRVAVVKGGWHARAVDPHGARILVVDEDMLVESPTEALRWLRVLEVLAHGFFEYAARESARGLFGYATPDTPHARPPGPPPWEHRPRATE